MVDPSALLQQAVGLHQQGRFADADAAYRRFLGVVPDHPDALRLLGLVALQTGAVPRAHACLERAAAANPASADTWQVQGGVRRQLGELGAAVAAYRRAAAVRPVFPDCHFNLGNALSQAGRFGEAAAAYRTAVAQQPLQPSYRQNLSGVLLRLGDAAGAAVQARAAIALEPQQPALQVALGRAETRRDGAGAGAAERAHRRAARLDPRNEEFAYDHAVALMEAGRLEAAAERFHALARSTSPQVRRGAKIGLHNILVRCSEANELERGAAIALTAPDGAALLPTRVRIEAASACNLRCRHCTTGVAYRSTDRRAMRLDLFERALAELGSFEALVSCVMYLGGEPLMNPHLATMIRRLRDGTSVEQIHFVTNAMLATEERCRELAASGVSRIFVSIDGRTPEENDDIRRGSHYPTVRENLRMLRRYLEPLGVSLVISNNILRRPGDPPVAVTPDFLRTDFPGLPISTSYAYKWPGWTKTDEEAALVVSVNANRRRGFCSAPFTETVVRANGEVTLCCYDISGLEVMGRITETPLAGIWNGERYKALRRAMLAGDEAALPAVCRGCPVYTGEELYNPPGQTGEYHDRTNGAAAEG
ncbi:MAG TPA: radical SAM protein [Azospirillum sp.]|nr:radical SAM protein [Azospirillum sp.]